jgi:hypothetical protein
MRTGWTLRYEVARAHVHDTTRIVHSTGSLELLHVAPDSDGKRELVVVVL